MIGDVTKEEALNHLAKRNIEKKDAKTLCELVGGRMRYLKQYSQNLKGGIKFEGVYNKVT